MTPNSSTAIPSDTSPMHLDSIERALADLAAGRMVIAVDDPGRENEGDLILPASAATAENIGFMVRHTSGILCTPMVGTDLDRLQLPPMVTDNQDPKQTAYTVSADAVSGTSTGISAADRATTIQTLANPDSQPEHLHRPGHVFPLRAQDGGVLQRPGHTEAAVDLTRLAGMPSTAVIAEIVRDDGDVARMPELTQFATEHELTLISISDLIDYRKRREQEVQPVAESRIPTAHGTFRTVGYNSTVDEVEHVALVCGEIGDGEDVLVRVHSECLTGDVFGSLRCDCGQQLDTALATVAAAGRGVVLYMRGHEGRGIGLLRKLQAYQLQDCGADTVGANLALGVPADARDYDAGVQILLDLGVRSVRLLTNNPDKQAALENYGLRVIDRVSLASTPTTENLRYLCTKRDRMGHHLPALELTQSS